MTQDQEKQAAAIYAAGFVEDGMVVGLGSGSTAERAIEALGQRHREGLRFVGVPTSKHTAEIAQSYGIPLTRLDELALLDICIDGADEVDRQLNLIKGHGGQLVREKLVASSAHQFVVVIDESKLVTHLGERVSVPVEVLPFGWTTTRHRLEQIGLTAQIRGADQPYVTANHNFILHCRPRDPELPIDQGLARGIKGQTGVVDHGLFFGLATMVVVGRANGTVDVLRRES